MRRWCQSSPRRKRSFRRRSISWVALQSEDEEDPPSSSPPSPGILIAAFKACAITKEVETGRSIHRATELQWRQAWSIYVHNALVDMYAKCNSVRDANAVFTRMPHHNQASWNSLVLASALAGDGEMALQIVSCMERSGCPATAPTYLAALKACAACAVKEEDDLALTGVKLHALERGMSLHSRSREFWRSQALSEEKDLLLSSTLIAMYSKCGSLFDARAIFDRMALHDVVSWTCLVLGYAERGGGDLALELFDRMTCQPNARTMVAALVACAAMATQEEAGVVKVAALERGRAIHAAAVASGFECDTFVANTLVDMYSRCGSLIDARHVFQGMRRRDAVSWNVLISGYAENGQPGAALDLFVAGIAKCAPTSRTFVAALTACCGLAAQGSRRDGLLQGRAVHARARESGCEGDLYVASALVDMYAKCGSLADAASVFERMPCHDVVSSTALMLGYAENGGAELALELYQRMQGRGAAARETFVAALKACAALADDEERLVKARCLRMGAEIHSQAAKSGHESDVFVANSLIAMYSKCGSLADARAVFDGLKKPGPSLVSWNALLLGYVENGEDEPALEIFQRMASSGRAPDARSYVAALMACGSLVALETGTALHGDICKLELERDNPFVMHRLVDFYAKCGRLADAQQVFDAASVETTRDVVIWSALIAGYSCQGDCNQVFRLFRGMEEEGVQPNAVTFISLLTACDYGGLVDEGRGFFDVMVTKYRLQPEIRHYHCMVDLLGRANRLDEAVAMIREMPYEATIVTWTAVLGACRKWNNVEVGRLAFEAVLKLDDSDAATHALMANIYASVGMWHEQSQVLAKKSALASS